MLTCPECGGEVVPDGGEYVCVQCGLIVAQHMVSHEKYVSFTAVDHHAKITTASDNPLKKKGNRAKVKTHPERRDDDIYHLVAEADAPDHVRATALQLVSKLVRARGGLPTSMSKEQLVQGCIYIAHRIYGNVNPPGDPELAERVEKILSQHGIRVGVSVFSKPVELISDICSQLKLPPHVRERAFEVYSEVPYGSYSARNIAAVCVARAADECELDITRADIARAAGANENSVGKLYRSLFGSSKKPPRRLRGVGVSALLANALYAIRAAKRA